MQLNKIFKIFVVQKQVVRIIVNITCRGKLLNIEYNICPV